MKIIRKKGRHKGQFNNRLVAVTVTICLLCCTVSAGLLAQPVVVYASVGTSIKSLIVTLIAAIGIGNSNPSFTNAMDQSQLLNSSYESLVDGSISSSALDQELSNLGVDVTRMTDVLGNSTEEAAAVSAQDTNNLLGEIGAATPGQNIQAAAEHLSETGEVGAAIGGKAAGVLNGMGAILPIIWDQQINSSNVQKLKELIQNETDYNIPENVTNGWRDGYINCGAYSPNYASGWLRFFLPYNVRAYSFPEGNETRLTFISSTQSSYIMSTRYGDQTRQITQPSNGVYYENMYGYSSSDFTNIYGFKSVNDLNPAINDYKATAIDTVTSPDLIGASGNQQGIINNNTINFPDIKPVINITNNNPTEYITPIDYDDYKNWQQTAQQNNQNGEIGQEQGEDFQNLIRDFINQWNGQIPQPTVAPVDPVNPIVTPVPSIPVTPTPSPEESAEIPKGFTTPELKDKFPFCIPYDIYTAFGLLTAEGEAPVFDWNITFGQYGTYNVHIDLSPWDPAARLLRILQLLLFIVCLAVGTRKLGGFGSGEEG